MAGLHSISTNVRALLLSVDYELFGNGTGDVRRHVTDPTDRMARLCEAHGVPLVICFEVEEYLAFERYRSELTSRLDYDPAAFIRDQIIDLVRRGHDIQLHLHPEWVGAEYMDGHWNLRENQRTIDSLFNGSSRRQQALDPQASANGYIAERKAVIDEMLAEAGVSQRVSVYRAGAFSAQPGELLLAALEANGITIDSSVVKGLTRNGKHVSIDYRNAPDWKEPWRVSNDVARSDDAGKIWEFPIYAEPGRRWQQLTFGRLKAKFSKNVPRRKRRDMVEQLGIKRTPAGLLRFLFQPVPIKLDYHNVTPTGLLRMIRRAPKPKNGLPDVLVTIGHTKEHIDDRPLDEFLRRAKAEGHEFITFHDLAEMMKEYDQRHPRPTAIAR